MKLFTFVSYLRVSILLITFFGISILGREVQPITSAYAEKPDEGQAGAGLSLSQEATHSSANANRRVIFIEGYPTPENAILGPDSNGLNDARNFWLEKPNSLGAFLRDSLPITDTNFLFFSYNGLYNPVSPRFFHPAYRNVSFSANFKQTFQKKLKIGNGFRLYNQ